MDGEAIQAIRALVLKAEHPIDINGAKHTYSKLHRVVDDRTIDPLQLHTLDGLVKYLKSEVEEYDISKCFLHVKNEHCVTLIGPLSGETLKRHEILQVFPLMADGFNFERWHDQEDFIIALTAQFEDTPDRQALQKYVSKVTDTTEAQDNDDGITQSAIVRKGASGAITESQSALATPILAPYRTFREIDQPESRFVFRMRGRNKTGGAPEFALFEADGGEWKIKAVNAIAEYLSKQLEGITIIA